MRTEDYIYQADASQSFPLSKRHVYAIFLTALIACSLYAVLPKQGFNDKDQYLFSSNSSSDVVDNSTSYEEIIDPTRSLTDVLLTDSNSHLAIDPNVNIASTNGQDAYTSVDEESLENYEEDLELEATLSRTDSEVNDLANRLNSIEGEDPNYNKNWITEEIKQGDTLSSIFSDLNIPYSTMVAIAEHKDTANSITNIRPGNKLYFSFDEKNNLIGFVKQINGDEQWHFVRTDVSKNEFMVRREAKGAHILVMTPDGLKPSSELGEQPAYKKRGRLVVATIGEGQSFSAAAHNAGLTYSEISTITEMFDGRVRFARDIREGDSLRVLFSDEKGAGKINAIELKLKRVGTLAVYRNITDDNFYDEKGYNVNANSFRRFPLDGKIIISSHFNPNRRHPVTKRVRPHNGTDFAVRIGTPVVSPADGIVEIAKYSKSAGYYITIRHRNSYSTVYMHLSKLLVKPGDKVKLGQMIARSGNTGMSTGPHLHYELRRNGRPINAMRVSLPSNEDVNIAKSKLQRFENNVALFKKELYQDSLIAKPDEEDKAIALKESDIVPEVVNLTSAK